MLGCAERKLLPLYDKLGFKNTKIYYQNTDLNNIEHAVILLDVEKVKKGKMNPISWNVVWGEAVQFGQKRQLITNNGWAACRVALWNWIRPYTNRLYGLLLKRNKKREANS